MFAKIGIENLLCVEYMPTYLTVDVASNILENGTSLLAGTLQHLHDCLFAMI